MLRQIYCDSRGSILYQPCREALMANHKTRLDEFGYPHIFWWHHYWMYLSTRLSVKTHSTRSVTSTAIVACTLLLASTFRTVTLPHISSTLSWHYLPHYTCHTAITPLPQYHNLTLPHHLHNLYCLHVPWPHITVSFPTLTLSTLPFLPHPSTLNPSHLSHHISPVSYHIQPSYPILLLLAHPNSVIIPSHYPSFI